jgi:hypothetical protein
MKRVASSECLSAGASDALTCLRCSPGTYSNATGACRGQDRVDSPRPHAGSLTIQTTSNHIASIL